MKENTMTQEHQQFVSKLSIELAKKRTTFDQFLRDVRLDELLTPKKDGMKNSKTIPPFPSSDMIITDLTSVDVVFGRGNNIAKHPGNWLFRQAVGLNKGYYATLFRELKSMAAAALVDQFLIIGTRFLEETTPSNPSNRPAFRIVERARVVEKFCQGLREKKFSTGGLVPVAKAGAVRIKKLKKKKAAPSRVNGKRAAKPAGSNPKNIHSDDSDADDEDWVPKGKSLKKKFVDAKPTVTLGAPTTSTPSTTSQTKKDTKKGKTKVAKKPKDLKFKKKLTKGKVSTSSSAGKTKETKDKLKKKASKLNTGASPSGELKTPSPKGKATKSPKPLSSSTSKSRTNSVLENEARRRSYETRPSEGSMPRPWTSSYSGGPAYSGPRFYAYPHFPPYFYPPEHYAHHGGHPLDPRYNNHRADQSPDSENPQPVAVTPEVAHYPIYPDPRMFIPMEPETLPNTVYWRKRVRLDNLKRNDKEILEAFMESYEDCKKYAHEMCKTHQETAVERFPADDEAENLVRVLRPSKLRKLSADKVSPMPVFHDS